MKTRIKEYFKEHACGIMWALYGIGLSVGMYLEFFVYPKYF